MRDETGRDLRRLWNRLDAGALYLVAFAMPISIAAANVAFGIGLLMIIRRAVSGGLSGRRIWNALTILILLSAAEDLLAILTSGYPKHFRHYFEDKWVLVAAFIPLWLVGDVKTGARALYLLMIAGLLAAIFALFQNVSGWNPLHNQLLESHGGGSMAVAFFSHHLTYGGIALLILCTALAWGLLGPGRSAPVRAAFVTELAAVGLFVTFARSALVGLAGSAVALLAAAPKKSRRRIAGIGAAGVIILLALVPGMMTRIGYVFSGDSDDESPRIRLWLSAIEIVKRYPLFGVGEGNWKTAFAEYGLPGHYVSTAHPHCDLLSTAVDGGIIAVLLFGALWVIYFARAFRYLKELPPESPARWGIIAGVSGVAGILVAGLFQNYLSDAEVANIAWFIVGMTVALGDRGCAEASRA